MRKILFLNIAERLEQVVWIDGIPTFEPDAEKRTGKRPVLLHFDLWNENIAQLTKQRPFPTPAVFFEFEPVRWSYAGQRVREADVVLRLHVITTTVATAEAGNRYRDKALERFDIIDALTQALLGFSYDDGIRQAGTMRAYESATDHDHGEVCEDIESWVTHCRDAAGCDIPQPTTHPLRLGIGTPGK